MRKLKVGIIGIGRIGKIHVFNLLRNPDVEVVCIADLHLDETLLEWAGAMGITTVTNDSMAVIHHPDVDAVFICSVTTTHVPLIVEAANANKHVFCEKPVSMDIVQTLAALDAVTTQKVKLQIGFNRRFDPDFRRLQQMVQHGKVGQPHIIKITSRDPYAPNEDYIAGSGGLFMDMAIHDYDMARFISGSEVVEVYAVGAVRIDPVFAQYGDVDTAVTTLTFANGTIAVIDNSRQAVYGYDQRIEVFASAGCLSVNNVFPNTLEWMTREGFQRDNPLPFFLERYKDAYIDEAGLFIQAILNDTEVAVDGNDALQAERIALAASLSYQWKRPVQMNEVSGLR